MSILKWEPLTPEQEQRVLEAIAAAELNTSGEIRVHIDKYCKTDPVFKAMNLFFHLKMEKTNFRNGVLLYIAKLENKFAIVGDEGINKVVPADFWESTKELMKASFSKGEITEGLEQGVNEIGVQLKEYFPYEDGDINELPDTISYG